jgi:hypothetical protein
MHVGKLLASSRRKVSLAVHVAHADNVLHGLFAAADSVGTSLLQFSEGIDAHCTTSTSGHVQ